MADFLNKLFGGGAKASVSPIPSKDADGFADFAGAPDPTPVSIIASSASGAANAIFSGEPTARPLIPYTKWYRVWERTTIADFYNELIILPFVLLIVFVHLWGTSTNRKKAKSWAKLHAPLITNEYSKVGFGGSLDSEILRENAANEFVSYATGRQNAAFTDFKITLVKRYNPLVIIGEKLMSFAFESLPATEEIMEATTYAFDGKEKDLVPVPKGESIKAGGNSSYDGFVWAVVNKDFMRRLRDERYDVSLTTTKEHTKLPGWASVMTESNEVTETLLTAELAKALEQAGDDLIALVITDQPMDKPKSLNDTIPRKRINLSLKLTSSPENTLPLFQYFLRLPDILVTQAHFRPEVMRKIKSTREEEIRKIRKVDEEEQAEARKEKADKEKKGKREQMLKGLSATEQSKFLEKEREKEMKRSQKKRTQRA